MILVSGNSAVYLYVNVPEVNFRHIFYDSANIYS